MSTNSRSSGHERSLGEDLNGQGNSGRYIDIDIDMLLKDERRAYLREGKQGGKALGRNGHPWVGATELHSNLQIEVVNASFHLHKFPLLSKSGRLNRLVFEMRDTEKASILLPNIPGGPEAFELCARFLYGGTVALSPTNVAALRCAAEYLEMTNSFGEGNLVAKTEKYLNFVVLGSWRESIIALKACSSLKPWAEDLEIVRRCSESIAWKASTDPHGIRWSFSSKGGARDAPRDWWFDDVCALYIDTFSTVINALNVKGMSHTMVAAAVVHYAEKWLPGLRKESTSSTNLRRSDSQGSYVAFTGFNFDIVAKDGRQAQQKNRALLHGIVNLLPTQRDAISCKFLLTLLGVACMVNAGPLCMTGLARRIGSQLEKVSVDDLLNPSFGSTSDSMYNIDVVQTIVDHYLQEQKSSVSPPGSPSGSVTSVSDVTSASSQTTSSVTSASSITSGSRVSTASSSNGGRRNSGSSTSSRSVSESSTGSEQSVSGSSVRSANGTSTTGSDSVSLMSASSVTSGSIRSESDGSSSTISNGASTSTVSSDESVKPVKKLYVSEIIPRKAQLPATTSNLKVAQLLQSYLEEVAKETNIPLGKFVALADSFSEFPRDSDDCLYRAIDVYLRAHPTLTEYDRKKLCRVMDTQQLSLDGCMHAASNERLPLRVVVQVLFSEQVKLRNAITGNDIVNEKDFDSYSASFYSTSLSTSSDPTNTTTTISNTNSISSIPISNTSTSIASVVSSLLPGGLSLKETLKVAVQEMETLKVAVQEMENLKVAVQDIEIMREALKEVDVVKSRLSLVDTLQRDMETMRIKFTELAQDYSGMTHQVEELTKNCKQKSGWSSGWKKIAKPFHQKEQEEKDRRHKDWALQKEHNPRSSTPQHKEASIPPLYQMKVNQPTDPPALDAPKEHVKMKNPIVVAPVEIVKVAEILKETPNAAVEEQEPKENSPDTKVERDIAEKADNEHHKDHHKDHNKEYLLTPEHRHHQSRSHHGATSSNHHRRHYKDDDSESVSSHSSFVSTSSTDDSHPRPKHDRHRDSSGHVHNRDSSKDQHHSRSLNRQDSNGAEDRNVVPHKVKSHHHKDHSYHHKEGSEHHSRDQSSGHRRHGDISEDHHHHSHKDHHPDSHHRHSSKEAYATPSNHSGHDYKEGPGYQLSRHHSKDLSDHQSSKRRHSGNYQKDRHHRHHYKDEDSFSDATSDSDGQRHRRHSFA